MANTSFVQTDFRGGIWSLSSQGRIDLPMYKTAMNECLNSMPMEEGAWTRRPGFRYVVHTRGGVSGKLLPFRFSRSQAYQAELTPLKLRFVVGLTLLRDATDDGERGVLNISHGAAQAKVRVADLPWANGDTVMFNITSDLPQSTTLYGRQFVISGVNVIAGTFLLNDPITGAPISGTEVGWINRHQTDTVERVLEYTTPYTAADIPNVRVVQDSEDTVLFMCPGKKTYALIVSGLTQFTFGVADFQDGPFLDENDLVTTMTLSALTGSVTVTASSTAGINEGDGFVSTDVGRLIWFQGGPAAWSNATPYSKNAKVLGSDNNIYRSLKGNNLAHDPITDTGTNWEITSDVVSITWLQITAVADTLHCTALIRGAAVTSGAATTHWRMGVYSDTTGYPTCGAYHEGRLVLAGAIQNRFDMSVSFKSLTFSPTEIDGTISDSNSVSGILNNTDAELISSMLSIDEGLFIGTLAGEWVLKASALDDPISPTSVQARSPNNTGSAAIEPMRIYGMPVFVQGRQRKVMTHRRVEGKFENVNHSKFASGLTSPKIVETAWCQEPMISFFCRLSDGKLIGAIHKVSQLDESFTGWHRHEHGMERTFTALSSGPNFSGTSDSLFVITAHPTDPAAPHWIETMMPVQSEGDQPWVAWHTDASGTGFYIRRMILANGDAYDGIKVYGLWHLNGETVHPFIGGLDLGNFVVALGSIDLPYAGSFTAAFLEGLNDGTDYSDWGVHLRWADAPVTTLPLHPLNTILVLDNEITATPSGDESLWDRENELFYRIDPASGVTESIRVFDGLTGDLVREAINYAAIFPDMNAQGLLSNTSQAGCKCLVGPESLVAEGRGLNGAILALVTRDAPPGAVYDLGLIDSTTLSMYTKLKVNQVTGGLDTHPPRSLNAFPFAYIDPLTLGLAYNNFAAVSLQGGNGRVRIYSLSEFGPLGAVFGQWGTMFSSDNTGPHDFHEFFKGSYPSILTTDVSEEDLLAVLLTTTFYSHAPIDNTSSTAYGGATSSRIYQWGVGTFPQGLGVGVGVVYSTMFDIVALTLDPTWVHGYEEFSTTYIATDDTFFIIASGHIIGNTRAVKIDLEGNIIWNVELPAGVHFPPDHLNGPWNQDRWSYMASNGVVYNIMFEDGAINTFTGMTTGSYNLQDEAGYYDEVGPSLITHSSFDSTVGIPDPSINFLGTYANAHHDFVAPNYHRIWLGTTFTQSQERRNLSDDFLFNPTNFGVSFTSRGQLLRPDYGQDAGNVFGPAFGKTRRIHRWAGMFSRAFNVKIGTDFDNLLPVKFTTPGKTPLQQPALFSGITGDTLKDDYSFEGELAWEVTRQYSCTITALGGFIAAQDR